MMQPQSCPTVAIQCEINGKPYSYAVSPTMSLLHFLRGQGLISVKEGCSVGECGACTVRVDGTAIDSCLYLAVWADGKSIRTVEGSGRATSSPTCNRPLSTRGRCSAVFAPRAS